MWKQLLVLSIIVALVAYWFFQDDKLDTLKGKRVLVTGSSDGIGEQIAYHYARLGASVVVTARRAEKLNKVVKECQTLSTSTTARFVAVPADMGNLNDTKRVIEQAVAHLGGLDILVLNHITGNTVEPFTGTLEMLEDLQQKIDINFRSYVHLASHALPQLTANEGSIIVVNSVVGKVPQTWMSTYTASKFAVRGFFTTLKNQFLAQGQNVSITSCYLGFIGTQTAMAHIKAPENPMLKFLEAASPSDTALDIVKGGARRMSEVYSPYMVTRTVVLLHSIWQFPIEYINGVMLAAMAGFD